VASAADHSVSRPHSGSGGRCNTLRPPMLQQLSDAAVDAITAAAAAAPYTDAGAASCAAV